MKLVSVFGLFVMLLGSARGAGETELTVSAAISLKGALEAVAQQYAEQHPTVRVVFNFGASGLLEKQLEHGAPVDLFISAGGREMKALEEMHLLEAGSRRDLLGNTLVLIVPRESHGVQGLEDLKSESVKRIAIGNPATVPAGNYAAQALAAGQLSAALEPKLVRAENVRQVLTYVETANVDAGFVYGTDARGSAKVRVVTVLPEDSHEPITYPAAILARAPHAEEARSFFRYLAGAEAGAIFAKAGFRVPKGAEAKD